MGLVDGDQFTRAVADYARVAADTAGAGEAHILNVCSISGIVAGGRFSAYHTSKFGLVGFTEAMRAEYNRRGIGVTNLCPGPVNSNLYNRALSGRSKPVPNPPSWLCASPERVARRGVRGIKKNKRIVLVTPLARLLYWSKRISPAFLDGLNHISRKKRPRPIGSSNADRPPQFDIAISTDKSDMPSSQAA